jgi:hypothetical protein
MILLLKNSPLVDLLKFFIPMVLVALLILLVALGKCWKIMFVLINPVLLEKLKNAGL